MKKSELADRRSRPSTVFRAGAAAPRRSALSLRESAGENMVKPHGKLVLVS